MNLLIATGCISTCIVLQYFKCFYTKKVFENLILKNKKIVYFYESKNTYVVHYLNVSLHLCKNLNVYTYILVLIKQQKISNS